MHKRLQYRINSKRSRALSQAMEQWREARDYHKFIGEHYSCQVADAFLMEIMTELEVIWDEQVELFFEIQHEFTEKKRASRTGIFNVKKPKPNYKE